MNYVTAYWQGGLGNQIYIIFAIFTYAFKFNKIPIFFALFLETYVLLMSFLQLQVL